jgi:superfamily I DNA and/or RNA helicase
MSLVESFITAINDEIKAIEKRGATKNIVLKNSEFIEKTQQGYIYQFEIDKRFPFIDDTPAELVIGNKSYKATLVQAKEFSIIISLKEELRENIPIAFIKIDTTIIWKKLIDALTSSSSNPQFNKNLAEKAFNLFPSKCFRGKCITSFIDSNGTELDPYQNEAIEYAVQSEVQFVHGPPGTGKTKTLAALIKEVVFNGGKVLVACHTNIAADNVVKTLIHYKHDGFIDSLFNNYKIVRIGFVVLPEVKEEGITLEGIQQKITEDLGTRLLELQEKLKDLRSKGGLLNYQIGLFRQKRALEDKALNVIETLKSIEVEISSSHAEIKRVEGIISEKRSLLATAEKRLGIINLLSGTRPKSIKEQIFSFEQHKNRESSRLGELQIKKGQLLSELEHVKRTITSTENNLSSYTTEDALTEASKAVYAQIRELETELEKYNAQIAELSNGIINNASIIVTTLAKTFLETAVRNKRFTNVLIDEASIAPLPMVYFATGLSDRNVAFFGDPQQLPPIAIAETDAVNNWLKRDIFQVANARTKVEGDDRIQKLLNQYRMHSHICEIVNKFFYDGELVDRRVGDNNEYNEVNPLRNKRVVLVDTSDGSPFMGYESPSFKNRGSRFNLYHAAVIRSIVDEWFRENNIKQKQIGIITPYRLQAGFIRDIVGENYKEIEIGTVHGFQGIEKEFIIFDYVEAPPGKNIGILVNDKHIRYEGIDPRNIEAIRLLTVACSRPKEKLVIVADKRHMLENLPPISKAFQLLSEIINNGWVIGSSAYGISYIPEVEQKQASLISKSELKDSMAFLNQTSFDQQFIEDLSYAKEEVIIFSPFITANRLSKLLPYLHKLSKKISIKLFTKPPREQKTQEDELKTIHKQLKNIGWDIYEYFGLHEKVAVIDNRILYWGSLNILSWNSTKEAMTRIENERVWSSFRSVLFRNYPRLAEAFIGKVEIDQSIPVDLTPNKCKELVEHLSSKKLHNNSSLEEIKQEYTKALKRLRKVISSDKRIPWQATLYNETIEKLLNDPPNTKEALLRLPEFARNPTNIRGYEDVILALLEQYKAKINEIHSTTS